MAFFDCVDDAGPIVIISKHAQTSVTIGTRITCVMVRRTYKAKLSPLFQSPIYSVPTVSASHIVVIRERMRIAHGASMLTYHLDHSEKRIIIFIPVYSPVFRSIGNVMGNDHCIFIPFRLFIEFSRSLCICK